MKESGAEKFWERFDKERKAKNLSIKTITETLGLSYPLLITQRSRQIFPSLLVACKIAKVLGSTVEYLTTGEKMVQMSGSVDSGDFGIPYDVVVALSRSTKEDLQLVRRIYRLPTES